MTTATRCRRPTREEFVAGVERGVLDDRLESWMPLESYGPQTDAEQRATHRANGIQTDGLPLRKRARGKPAGPAER